MLFKHVNFKAIKSVPERYWQDLDCTSNIYYSPEFLNAFERANTNIEFHYIFVLRNEKAVAFANTQLITIGVKTISQNIKMASSLKYMADHMFCNNHIRVLFCGNVFLSGEYGTFLREGEPKIETFMALTQGVKSLYKAKKLNAIFIKDFEDESLYITDHLKTLGYTAMHVEPNMIIKLKPEWQSFKDYTNALKSKYRVKANRADGKSDNLATTFFEVETIQKHKTELQLLYQNTIANADFNAQILNLDTYIHLKTIFKDKFIIKGYFLEDKLVGFLSAMRNGKNLDAHFIGINYNYNKDYAIYPRILNDYVRIGIDTKSSQINLGRTASEIKSTLGAQPKTLTCYFRHKHALPNKMLQPFVKNVKIKSFKQHQPFKDL